MMKNILLIAAATVALAQAGDVVHYDKNGKTDSVMSKPNHPSSGLYTK